MFHDGRLKLFLEQGQKFSTDSHAHPLRVAVGGIFAPGLFSSAQKTPKLAPANVQQWTDDRTGDGMDSAKPREACSAKEMRKHGLRLIVGSVRHHDSPAISRFCQRTKIVVPRPPCRVLEVGPLLFRLLRLVNRSGVNMAAEHGLGF